MIIFDKVLKKENENVRVYFCSKSSKEARNFRRTGTKDMRKNHILGVDKFSHMWLLLTDAEKTIDVRRKDKAKSR